MATHNTTGKKGEQLAVQYLQQQGFEIVTINWRFSHYEIDIFALKNEVLHFIEVKTRTGNRFGYPEESVSEKKLESLMKGAAEYLEQNSYLRRVQYDVLSITMLKNRIPEFFFIEDVYL